MSILSYSTLTTNQQAKPKMSKKPIKESYIARARNYINESRKVTSKSEQDHMKFINECTNPKEYFSKFKCMLDCFNRKIYTFTDQMNTIQDAFTLRISTNYKPVDILSISRTFTEEDEFYFDKYDYTNLDNPMVPSTDSVFDFAEYYEKMKNVLAGATVLTEKQKYEKLMSLVDDLRANFSDKHYQKFRGDIIGTDELLYATDYPEELFNTFRANGNIQSNSLIDIKYLATINKDILNTKKFIDQTNTIKNNIVALYTGIINKMDPLFSVIYDGSAAAIGGAHYQLENQVVQALCLILNIVSSNLSKLMDIHMLAYTSKLDAIVDYYEQSVRILDIAAHKAATKGRWYGLNESSINLFTEETAGVEESITRVFENGVFMDNLILESTMNKLMIDNVILEADTKKASKGFAAIKEFIQDIMKKVSEVIGKFTERAMNFISSDKGYLEHYKDIILQHPLASTDITDYYNYNLIDLVKIEVPELNYAAMKDQLKDEETFIKARFSQYIKNKDASLKDNIIATIQGDPINIPNTATEDGKRINRTDLYNYVMGYGKLNKSIEDDLKTFETAQKTATAEVDRIQKEMESHQTIADAVNKDQNNQTSDSLGQAVKNAAQAQSTTPPQQPAQQTTQQTVERSSAIINDPMATYFSEMEINKTGNTTANGGNTSNATNPANNPANSNTNVQNNANTTTMSQNYANDAANDQKNAMEAADAVKTYFTVGSAVLSAKLTLANAAYKQSMDIIRWHVQNFNNSQGKKEVSQDAQSNGTNYETGQPGSPSKAQQANQPQEKQGLFSKIKNALSGQ